jgi:hypothetical protein
MSVSSSILLCDQANVGGMGLFGTNHILQSAVKHLCHPSKIFIDAFRIITSGKAQVHRPIDACAYTA